MPVLEQVANRLVGVKYLTIAKVNGLMNDITKSPTDDFPTLKLFPARNKDAPITYKGEFVAEDLIDWFQAKATWAKWPKNPDEL